MKLAIVIVLLLTNTAAFGQRVLLTEGSSYVFEFTSLNHTGQWDLNDGFFIMSFSPGTCTLDEVVQVDLFSDTLADIPLTFYLVSAVDPTYAGPVVGGYSWGFLQPAFWPDLQGMARITMFDGDAELDGISVRQVVGGNVYEQSFLVPEPSISVLSVGGMLTIAFRMFGSKRFAE